MKAVRTVSGGLTHWFVDSLHESAVSERFRSMRDTDSHEETELVDVNIVERPAKAQLDLPTLKVETARELVYLADDVYGHFTWLRSCLRWLSGVGADFHDSHDRWEWFHLHWSFAGMCEEPTKTKKRKDAA